VTNNVLYNHLASYAVGSRSSSQLVKQPTHHLVFRSRMHTAIPPLSHMVIWCGA